MAVVLTPGAQAADPAGAGRVVDPILLEVVNQRLQSITDEMETVLCRSAFSSLIKEALDASAGLYDKHGDTLAQAAALPGHLGSLVPAVKRVLRSFPVDTMSPGDVYCFNEPYEGGTHLPDFTIVMPGDRMWTNVSSDAFTVPLSPPSESTPVTDATLCASDEAVSV